MERTIEEAIDRAKRAYQLVTGQPVPEVSAETPYARIPPEVDREEYVLKQAASLFERVQAMTQPNNGTTSPKTRTVDNPEEREARWVIPLPGVPKDNVSVEFADGLLTIRVRAPARSDSTQKLEVR